MFAYGIKSCLPFIVMSVGYAELFNRKGSIIPIIFVWPLTKIYKISQPTSYDVAKNIYLALALLQIYPICNRQTRYW